MLNFKGRAKEWKGGLCDTQSPEIRSIKTLEEQI